MLTICIPNLNGGPFLTLAVLSVRRYLPGYPIWISDHGSSDGSKEWAQANCTTYDSVSHITGSHGVPIDEWSLKVTTKYFLLVDCDVEVIGEPIKSAMAAMEADESISVIDGSRFEVGGIPYTNHGKEFIQQSRIDPSFALVRTSHARELVKAGDSWGFRTVGDELFDTGAWTKRVLNGMGRKTLRCDQMRSAHIHYGNVSWARNAGATFDILKKYVKHREIVEEKLKAYPC
jgi:glycosyltransferase involved in cell wall biosynthesis